MKSFYVCGRASSGASVNHRSSKWVAAGCSVAVLLLSSCAAKTVVIPGGIGHPAEPASLQAPLPPMSTTLTSDPVTPPPPATMGGHDMHGMKH